MSRGSASTAASGTVLADDAHEDELLEEDPASFAPAAAPAVRGLQAMQAACMAAVVRQRLAAFAGGASGYNNRQLAAMLPSLRLVAGRSAFRIGVHCLLSKAQKRSDKP